jgi:hypothetical protein
LSISNTRAPARASRMAVAAPAQRAPTMTASNFMPYSLIYDSDTSCILVTRHSAVNPAIKA